MVLRPQTEHPGSGEAMFLSQLATIERVIAFVCARHRLVGADAEDFSSYVKLKFVESDYAVLGKFQGRSSVRTYLAVVIGRLALDFRIAAWGKWRPSAAAKRQGATAVLLEQLLTRDGHTFEEAYELVTTNHGVTLTRVELERLAGQLPLRIPRRHETDEALADLPSSHASADGPLIAHERTEAGGRLVAALRRAKARFEPQDRLIIAMRFEDGLSVAAIAAALRLDQKALYRRFERLLRELRAALELDGVTAEEVREMLDAATTGPETAAGEVEPAKARPSISKGAQKWR
jgi:RNA polymerase sigma factor (sigma-70 family)